MARSKIPPGAHELVFGASGLAGWGVVDQLLENYPAEGTFSKVTALVNRPFSVAESYWPSPSPSRPKLELVSNVNLAEGTVEEFTALLKEKVENIAMSHMRSTSVRSMKGQLLIHCRYTSADECRGAITSLQTGRGCGYGGQDQS